MNYKYKKLNGVKCPVCLNDECFELHRVKNKQAVRHFIREFQESQRFKLLSKHILRLWGKDFSIITKCNNCDFCFPEPYVCGDEKFYSLAYPPNADYPSWKWDFQITAEYLQKLPIDNTYNYLELGAGKGAFVEYLLKEKIFSNSQITCTEFNKQTREAISNMGIKCYSLRAEDLVNLEEHVNNYSVICLFQSIEHMSNINEVFAALNKLLKVNGLLFITVPNSYRIEFNELNGALLDMPPNHVGRWTRKAFKIIGEKHNFSLIDFKNQSTTKNEAMDNFINSKIMRAMQNPFSPLNIPVLNKSAEFIFKTFCRIKYKKYFDKESLHGMSSWVLFNKDC
ncbi:MAG: hypothetical protein ACD_20C00413G0019 [uncultured bacterium]|nr:MAG: hypothetical protein ACD_20C00413G0019 [uncultured bacterium]